MPPHPSPIPPQYRDAPVLQVVGTQPDPATHRPEVLQLCPASQPPQSRARPQPSPILPQYFPVATWHILGTQAAPSTHWWSSHSCPAGQSPQSSAPPQRSPITPQYRPLTGRHVTDALHETRSEDEAPSGPMFLDSSRVPTPSRLAASTPPSPFEPEPSGAPILAHDAPALASATIGQSQPGDHNPGDRREMVDAFKLRPRPRVFARRPRGSSLAARLAPARLHALAGERQPGLGALVLWFEPQGLSIRRG